MTFDVDKWLSEGEQALRELCASRDEKRIERTKLDEELTKLDADIDRLENLLLASDGLHADDCTERQTGVKAAARDYFAHLNTGDCVDFEQVENGVAERMEGEVPKGSTLKGALRALVNEGLIQKVDMDVEGPTPQSVPGWKKVGGLPVPETFAVAEEVFERLKERLRLAGKDGIIPTSTEEKRVLEFWASKWLVEVVSDLDEGTYRLTDDAVLLAEEAPAHRKKLFEAEPPRHAR